MSAVTGTSTTTSKSLENEIRCMTGQILCASNAGAPHEGITCSCLGVFKPRCRRVRQNTYVAARSYGPHLQKVVAWRAHARDERGARAQIRRSGGDELPLDVHPQRTANGAL